MYMYIYGPIHFFPSQNVYGHACVPGLVASGLDAEVCCGPLVISWSSVE